MKINILRYGPSIILLSFASYLLINYAIAAEKKQGPASDSDSLVMIQGNVFDKESTEPIKATIYYRRLPYGSEYGIINTKDTCGSYEIYLFQNQAYQVTVKSEGYFANIKKIDLNADFKQVNKNFYLQPLEQNKILKLESLNFNQGDYQILEESFHELNQVVFLMKENENLKIQLEGHTDFRGSDKQNLKLSKQRVRAVKKYLHNKGIKNRRIKTRAFGGSAPLSKKNTPGAKKMNRRVEIRVLNM